MNKLLVWFHSFPEEPEVIIDSQLFEQINVSVFHAANGTIAAKKLFSGDFNQLIEFITNNGVYDDVEIVLPAKYVLYTQVAVPSKSRNRIMQAIPFLLEDNLIKDIDRQFFALGDIKNGLCNIAIVSRFIIQKIYEQFERLAMPVSIITSDLFQLPYYKNKWTMSCSNNEIYLRTGEQSGMTFNVNNIHFFFSLLLNKDHIDIDKTEDDIQVSDVNSEADIVSGPESIIIYAQKELDAVKQIQAVAHEYDIDTEVVKGDLLTFALSEAKSSNKNNSNGKLSEINLLQGEFHPGSFKKTKIPFVKSLAAVFVIWLVTQAVFMGYQWQLYKNELSQLETHLEQRYFKIFPDSKRLINVRSQAESKFKQLQKNASVNDSFLNIVGLVGSKIRHIKEIKVQNLRYNDGILQLDILSRGFIFNKLKADLQGKKGLLLEEKSSSRVQGEVHTVINFRMNQL